MSGILNAFTGGTYTSTPGAPTIGTATATGATTATVAFTAPSFNGGSAITGYQALSSPGSITATGASSPITVTGLTASTSYTFTVRAQNAIGYGAYSGSSNSITTSVAPSSQSYTTPGTYCWVAPAGVTKVSVVAIGGGGLTGGGGLGYINNYTVVPGNTYSVVVGRGGVATGSSSCNQGKSSYFINTSTVRGGGQQDVGYPATYVGTGGGNGGYGAGGYSGSGAGGYNTAAPAGGGGGGGYSLVCNTNLYCNICGVIAWGGGGGVGLFGQGSSGGSGTLNAGNSNTPSAPGGGGGSGGASGSASSLARLLGKAYLGAGGAYGGGTGATGVYCPPVYATGATGAVRIVWPGNTRTFPSTCVGSP